jgi:dTDP-glucose pyrophosphorylase/CBS domain-containing protein
MMDYKSHIIPQDFTVIQALERINRFATDLTLFVVDSEGQMVGSLTDGDIRRGLLKGVRLDDSVDKVMHKNFRYLNEGNFSVEEIKGLKKGRIQLVPVLNKKKELVKVYDFGRIKSVLPLDAVLMAGGRGERLRPLTDTVPKPLLDLGGKPIIEHNIDNLIRFGVENIYITVKYLGEQLIEYFTRNKKEANIFFVKESKPLGTIGSVTQIKDFKKDNILVMNSDLFTNIDFEEFFLHFSDEKADMSIASTPYNVDLPFAVLNLSENHIVSFKEKPTYTYFSNAGIYLLKRKALEHVPVQEFFNATDLMQALIDNKFKLTHFPIMGYWIDIGRPEDYRKAQEYIKYL